MLPLVYEQKCQFPYMYTDAMSLVCAVSHYTHSHHNQLSWDVNWNPFDILPQQWVEIVETDEQEDTDDRRHYRCTIYKSADEDQVKKPNHSLQEFKAIDLRASFKSGFSRVKCIDCMVRGHETTPKHVDTWRAYMYVFHWWHSRIWVY